MFIDNIDFSTLPLRGSQGHMTATTFIYIKIDELGTLKHATLCRFVTMFHLFDCIIASPLTWLPCGSCGKAVRNGQNSIECESCEQWYHIEFEGFGVEMRQLLCERESYSWVCLNCGLPNLSTGLMTRCQPSTPQIALSHWIQHIAQ